MNFKQFSNLICPVDSGSSLAYRHMPPTSQWLCKDKNTTGSIANVFSIPPFRISRLHRDGGPCFIQQLIWFFVHAYNGIQFIKWLLIQIQNIFHAGHKRSILLWWNTPAFTKMWLEFVFLKGALPPHERYYQCTLAPRIYQPRALKTT